MPRTYQQQPSTATVLANASSLHCTSYLYLSRRCHRTSVDPELSCHSPTSAQLHSCMATLQKSKCCHLPQLTMQQCWYDTHWRKAQTGARESLWCLCLDIQVEIQGEISSGDSPWLHQGLKCAFTLTSQCDTSTADNALCWRPNKRVHKNIPRISLHPYWFLPKASLAGRWTIIHPKKPIPGSSTENR